jgi:L-alanine-DL-glutamate epimerase-like enolase superfamily enzyme
MEDARIARVEWGRLPGRRPRAAGSNARLGPHGAAVTVPIVRLTADDGATGFGACYAPREQLAALLGARLSEVFSPERGVADAWLSCEYPLWDLAAKRAGVPVYALAAGVTGAVPPHPYRVRCYDTSLYFDDLHLATDEEAADLLAREALEGYERGHRAFKLKVGRGARHMPVEEGTRRDVAIVRAVRAAVGTGPALMLDANDGYTLNLAKRVLSETADCGILWIEEAFREDPVLYGDLREWLAREGLPMLIADGEGQADPRLLEWARAGLVDVVQYDIFSHGPTRWLATGRLLDGWSARSAPHHYGTHYGNYAACHLAGAIAGFAYAEWDEVATPGLDATGYSIRDGLVDVPAAPGFGLELDEEPFRRAVEDGGVDLSV